MSKRLHWKPAISELAAGTLQNSTGDPVEAVSVYATPPSDGRPLLDILNTSPNDGRPTVPVSFYPAGTLATADGRPVAAGRIVNAASAVLAQIGRAHV